MSYNTVSAQSQGQADKDKVPSSRSGGSPRQEQGGSRRQCHRALNIYILFIGTPRPFSKGVPKKHPNLKQIRTERTLAESRAVLI